MPTKLYSYVKLTDTTDLTGLKFMEKIRAIYYAWFVESGRSEVRDSRNAEDITRAELTLQADLLEFISKATLPIKKGERNNVICDIASEFEPVFDVVINSSSITRFYKVKIISRPRPDIDIKYKIRVRLEAI